ncbi:MAG: dephospho-CoA kinase, partial [Clostridia bacterium]|nr:dephospho-CoA kinase [Clostridia bacterium]
MKTKFIGLTGQTGAGKSTVSEFAKKMGYKIINADKVAREVMKNGSECVKRLAEVFGSDIIETDGSLNRKLL